MPNNKRQSGMTLTELLVVIAVMAILLGVSVPTAKHLMNGFESSTGVRYLINAALSNARAIAVRNQAYAGVRFQQASDGFTYMVFIIYDYDATGDADGFRAVTGRKPMKLPEGVSVSKCSVVFSSAGKLATRTVQCLRGTTNDTIFNSDGLSMFYEDGSASTSRPQITIVTKGKYDSETEHSTEYISPYTGELVMEYHEEGP